MSLRNRYKKKLGLDVRNFVKCMQNGGKEIMEFNDSIEAVSRSS